MKNITYVAPEKSNPVARVLAIAIISACTFTGSFTLTALVYSGISGQVYTVGR